VERDSQLHPSIDDAPARRPLLKRRSFWILVSVAGFLVVLTMMFIAAVPLSSDTLRHRIIRTLSDKLDSDVELGDLHLRVWPGMRAEGTDLRIRRRGAAESIPPLITVKSFHVDASILGLMRKHVDHVLLTGLDINIPPKPERQQQEAIRAQREQEEQSKGQRAEGTSGQTPEEKKNDPLKAGGVVLDRVDTDNARLIIIPDKEGKQPKVWAIHHLTMHDMGAVRPWPFQATLTNGVPPGEISVDGDFGPWDRNEPGDTKLDGDFSLAKADLSVFKGISGTLSSKGSFNGTLDEIHTTGETDTPDFMIKVGGHAFRLQTKYQALIDGTNGDTRLETIDASFLGSHLIAKGAVLDAPKGQHGRTVSLDVDMDKARVEDVMTMAVNTPTPPMAGGLRLTTKFLLPPGETDVSERLRLDGRFTIARAKFTSPEVQAKIDDISRRARGKVEQATQESVMSDFQGHFKLADGKLALPDLTFAVPGAKVQLAGYYALKPESLEFKGQALLDAQVSETVTGWKKWIMKPADTIFKQLDGTGSLIPIKITGSRKEPKFGLDVKAVLKRRG
jgi:hypothetical protein